jgi:hypothetical protein
MQNQTIYLAYTAPDMEALREELLFTLFNAGFNVMPTADGAQDESLLKKQIEEGLNQSACSIHLIGNDYGREIKSEMGKSLSAYQYEQARAQLSLGKNFRIFVWHPQNNTDSIDPKQLGFISDLQNNIAANMTYTNTPSSIQLADDIRSMMEVTEKPNLQLNQTEIFFISNMLDDLTAEEITDMLSDVTQIEKITIEQDSDTDYAELSSQQISKSKLAVVYFKDSADWAIPFAQQVWKKVGGAATKTPILVIGDEDPDTNRNKGFKAPKVISMIMAGELIPLEIKVQYDKVTES